MFGAFKAGLGPVNTNYRYTADELVYLWDNADVVAVVFHGTFVDPIERGAGPAAARPHVAVGRRRQRPAARSGPSPTRRRPPPLPSTAWPAVGSLRRPPAAALHGRHDRHAEGRDVAPGRPLRRARRGQQEAPPARAGPRRRRRSGRQARTAQPARRPADARHRAVQRAVQPDDRGQRRHAWRAGASTRSSCSTPSSTSASTRCRSSATPSPSRSCGRSTPSPDRWDVSSLRVIVSSGVIWSAESKAGLLRHNDRLIMVDSLGSQRGHLRWRRAPSRPTARRRRRRSGSGRRRGWSPRTVGTWSRAPASSGWWRCAATRPIGYYKDPEKSAATFQVIDGQRYSIPGDFATVDADGTVRLLGRGSQCINTGGEKVYPEEVEEVLKLHPTVADAAVVGVPDERFGEAITALVEPHAGVDRRRGRRSSPTSSSTSPATRHPSACCRSRRSGGRPTASSTTAPSRPSPSPRPEPTTPRNWAPILTVAVGISAQLTSAFDHQYHQPAATTTRK